MYDDSHEWRCGWIALNGDIETRVLAQYPYDVRWNGFLIPALDAWSVVKVLTYVDTVADHDGGWDWDWREDGALVLIDRQWRTEDPEGFQPEVLEPSPEGLYPLGAYGWVWSETEPTED